MFMTCNTVRKRHPAGLEATTDGSAGRTGTAREVMLAQNSTNSALVSDQQDVQVLEASWRHPALMPGERIRRQLGGSVLLEVQLETTTPRSRFVPADAPCLIVCKTKHTTSSLTSAFWEEASCMGRRMHPQCARHARRCGRAILQTAAGVAQMPS